MTNANTKLLLNITDLMIEKLQSDGATPEKLNELLSLREEVQSIYVQSEKEHNKLANFPDQLEALLREFDPDVFPISIDEFNTKPLMFLLTTAKPIRQETSDMLDEYWPDLIVLSHAPV